MYYSSHLNLSNRRRRSSCARGFVWRNGECVRMGQGNQTRSGQNASYNKTYPYYSGKLPGDGSHTVTDVLDCVKCAAGWHTCHICDWTMGQVK